jgi:hypothetical protein
VHVVVVVRMTSSTVDESGLSGADPLGRTEYLSLGVATLGSGVGAQYSGQRFAHPSEGYTDEIENCLFRHFLRCRWDGVILAAADALAEHPSGLHCVSPFQNNYASPKGRSLQNSPTATRPYCSQMNGAEPLWGTAESVDVWLCLEYKPVWRAKALADNDLGAPTRTWLAETLRSLTEAGFKVRPQFIRQPDLDRSDTRLLVAFQGQVYEFSGQGYGFLENLDLTALLSHPERLADVATSLDEPRYLVCTNGQRDLCCARFGLPVYTALRELVGDRVWQVTHLGGHRFAPNVLVVPSGCVYGRVSEQSLAAFLKLTEAGDTDFSRLRGRSCYPGIVQAAEASLGRQAVRLLHFEGDDTYARITFVNEEDQEVNEEADDQERFSVVMQRAEQGSVITKSCGDEETATVFPYLRV